MALQDLASGNQKTRDELSSEPNVQPIYKIKSETVTVEEAVVYQQKETIGHSFILGHSVNGKLGSTYLGDDGSQIVLGEAGRVTTVLSVISPNDLFIERFNYDNFKASATTADWTGGSLNFTTGEVAQSEKIADDGRTFLNATIDVTLSSGVIGDLTLQLSADGGSNWETVTNLIEHTFTNTGSDLRFKITASGTVGVSVIKVNYS